MDEAKIEEVESEEPVESSEPSIAGFPIKTIKLAGVLVVLGLLLVWAGSIRTQAARIQEFERAVDSIAGTLRFPLLDSKSERSSQGRNRMSELANEIRVEGDYTLVLITDEEGNVLASTDRKFDGKQIDELADAPLEAKTERRGGRWTCDRLIRLNTSPIGAIRISREP